MNNRIPAKTKRVEVKRLTGNIYKIITPPKGYKVKPFSESKKWFQYPPSMRVE